jgi:antitoxin HicB
MTDLNFYLSLPYTRILRRDDDGAIIASVQELAGCIAHGTTETEALANLAEVQALWLEEAIANGIPVPIPEKDEPLPSGKWVQRVSRSLHRALTLLAETEDVSLNQLVATILAEAVGRRRAIASARFVRAQMVSSHLRHHLSGYHDLWHHHPPKWTTFGSNDPIDVLSVSGFRFCASAPDLKEEVPFRPLTKKEDFGEVTHGK